MRLSIALLATLLLAPATPVRATTAEELVAKNVAARGGAARLDALRSLRPTGRAAFGFGDAQFKAEFAQLVKRPGMIRTEISVQGLTEVEAWDGRDAFDRRAPYTIEDRKAQFAAVMKAHALFEEMSALVDRIDAARAAAGRRAKALPESDPGRRRAQETVEKLDAIKREIVATKEGGAITGEERIREHLDTVYGALNGWEGKPAAYQVERVEALRRELADVAKGFDALSAAESKPDAKGAGGAGVRP